ncbi:MAG: hypothetical protein ABFS02_11760 [Pseudomonadota bacterium]
MISYLGLVIASTAIILVFDDDPTAVSPLEWVMFAVLIYSGWSVYRIIRQLYRDNQHR